MRSWLLLIILASVLSWASCEKISDEPAFSVEPHIRLDSLSATELVEFEDQLHLWIWYEDGDGDLGTSDPDLNLITVQDARLSTPDTYYLPPLAPEQARVSIQGRIELVLAPTFVLGNAPSETTTFTIWFTDRAGHESNHIVTPPITILKQ